MQNPSAIRRRPRATATAPARELPWTFILLAVVCACVVAAGFFFAARQHFTSMDYGLKNSKLREQLQNLEAEKRRLMLAREMAISPLAIRKAARSIGLKETSDVEAVAASSTSKPVEKTAPIMIKAKAADARNANEVSPTVVRTTMSRPVQPRSVQPKSTGETRSRVVESTRRSEVVAVLKFR